MEDKERITRLETIVEEVVMPRMEKIDEIHALLNHEGLADKLKAQKTWRQRPIWQKISIISGAIIAFSYFILNIVERIIGG